MVGFGTYSAVLDALAQTLGNQPYLAGPEFTAADVYVGSQIGWSVRAGHADGYPALAAYWSRLAARPAYARAKALDDAAEADVAP
jgi:glutathione S-transferase